LTDSLISSGHFIEQDRLHNEAKHVANIGSQYMGHGAQIIQAGLQNPTDRIIYSNLEPDISSYQAILDISIQAGNDTDLPSLFR